MIRILIASRARLYSEGLCRLLEPVSGLEVAGIANTIEGMLEDIRALRPGVALVDTMLGPPELVAALIFTVNPDITLVALGHDDQASPMACLEAGFAEYVPPQASGRELLAKVEGAARGELQLSPPEAAAICRRLARLAALHPSPSPEPALTLREREIVILIDEGCSNKQIALRLGIEVATVKNHVHNLLEKLRVHRRAEAAAWIRTERRTSRLTVAPARSRS